jgi:hypothetical protein
MPCKNILNNRAVNTLSTHIEAVVLLSYTILIPNIYDVKINNLKVVLHNHNTGVIF